MYLKTSLWLAGVKCITCCDDSGRHYL